MIPAEITGLFHYLPPENPANFPAEFNMIQTNIPLSSSSYFYNNLNSLVANFSGACPQELGGGGGGGGGGSSISNNSTSDEDHHHQAQSIIDERKQRRMISNRESARRSRMRKQKHLDELWSQVIRLRNENNALIDKLNRVSESQDRVLKENARLKEEASDLRQLLTEMRSNCNDDDEDSTAASEGSFGINFLRELEDLNPSTKL